VKTTNARAEFWSQSGPEQGHFSLIAVSEKQLKYRRDLIWDFQLSKPATWQTRFTRTEALQRLNWRNAESLVSLWRQTHVRQQWVLTDGTYSGVCDRHTWQLKSKTRRATFLIVGTQRKNVWSEMWGRQHASPIDITKARIFLAKLYSSSSHCVLKYVHVTVNITEVLWLLFCARIRLKVLC